MKKQLCLNFCEILENILLNAPKVETVIQNAMELAGYTECERIYVGSYFCSQYVLNTSMGLMKKLLDGANRMGIPVTLVLPMFTEKDLSRGKEKIAEFIPYFQKEIDEITVNDYGMLEYIHQKFSLRINLGRLLFKDYRDPRYGEYYHQTSKPKYFSKQFLTICREYHINSLELDIPHERLELSDAPEDITISVHIPYTYMTVGMVCEFASIPYEISNKFRPNLPCNKDCLKNRLISNVIEDRTYIKIGRTVYFEHAEAQVDGTKGYREIFAPIQLSYSSDDLEHCNK